MGKVASLVISTECRTVSKALLKSQDMTCTYGWVSSEREMDCKSEMRAAVVDPVGLKAYWS